MEKKGLVKANKLKPNFRLFNINELERVLNKTNGKHGENHYKILKAKKKSNYSVIELFAGAGGTALGFDHAGLEHILLSDINKDSVSTLKKNKPKWNILEEDITKMNFKSLSADIVSGGFPCQAFSYAGKKLGFEDARGTLFFDFARCIKEVKPKVIMGENVRGLLKHDHGKTLQSITSVLIDLGYNIAFKVLKAQYFDVPQKRERLIILGVRKDLNLPIFFPKEKDYLISLKEALQNCPKSEGQQYSKRKKEIMKLIPEGGYWRNLPKDLQKQYMSTSYYTSGGKTGMARRLSWNEPSLTLTCAPAQKQTERCHPKETRPLTIREYARIQTFPDSWEFIGSISSQYRQIGNAVPVNLGFHIGQCIIAMLNKKIDPKSMYKTKVLKELKDFKQMSLF